MWSQTEGVLEEEEEERDPRLREKQQILTCKCRKPTKLRHV